MKGVKWIIQYYLGSEKFKGRILHSHKYRDYQGFEGKDIFIVGIGNSALDIAAELSGVSKSVSIIADIDCQVLEF